MTYLRACIDECLRLCPPIPKALPREVLPGGLEVDGEFFPEGVNVGVPAYALHHSEKHFERPFVYDPSRWLVEGTGGVREAFIPFSLGPRQCIGKNVALLELYVGVARALWLYNVRIAPGYEWMGVGREGEYKMKDNFIVGKEGPMLQFQRRI
jgi:cytochrome P450